MADQSDNLLCSAPFTDEQLKKLEQLQIDFTSDDLADVALHCPSSSNYMPFHSMVTQPGLTAVSIQLVYLLKSKAALEQEQGETPVSTVTLTVEDVKRFPTPDDVKEILPYVKMDRQAAEDGATNVDVAADAFLQFDDEYRPIIPEGYVLFVDGLDEKNDPHMRVTKDPNSAPAQPADGHMPETGLPTKNQKLDVPLIEYEYRYSFKINETGVLAVEGPIDMGYYNYAEHCLIGDSVERKWGENGEPDGTPGMDEPRKLKLKNGMELTYGQINGLGGDFFGAKDPISQGKDFKEQCDRFLVAFRSLADNTDPRAKPDLEEILKSREDEVKQIAKARIDHTSTAEIYKKLGGGTVGGIDKDDIDLAKKTSWRDNITGADKSQYSPSYFLLALLNVDHFGEDARKAYNAGHYCAMQEAAKGDLELAYAMNAFADHFIGDLFAAGHLRTPRAKLHASDTDIRGAYGELAPKLLSPDFGIKSLLKFIATHPFYATALIPDLCSKYMHTEDNSLGLWVRNKSGELWKAYGDAKLFETENKDNMKRLQAALKASADEVYDAYKSRKPYSGSPDSFAVWDHTPVLSTVNDDPRNHKPLFDSRGWRRYDVNDINRGDYWEVPIPHSFRGWPGAFSDLKSSDRFNNY